MQIKSWALSSAILIGTNIFAYCAHANTDNGAKDVGVFDADDGTYDIQIVTSFEACVALCEADAKTCRGSVASETVVTQNDVSTSTIECRLNNGFGAKAAFPSTPPEPLDLKKALSDLNAYRISKGRNPLNYDERLNRAAQLHSQDMATHEFTSHDGSNGSKAGDRVQLQGYYFSITGENVASGQKSWEHAFKSWQESKGHNKNMLQEDMTELGLALAYEPTSKPDTYWTMILATPINIDGSEDGE